MLHKLQTYSCGASIKGVLYILNKKVTTYEQLIILQNIMPSNKIIEVIINFVYSITINDFVQFGLFFGYKDEFIYLKRFVGFIIHHQRGDT